MIKITKTLVLIFILFPFISLGQNRALGNRVSPHGFLFSLQTQRELGMDVPISQYVFLSAHNSWNNSYAVWANQRFSLRKLLKYGVRGFDLDVHSYEGKVVLCHDDCKKIFAAKDSYENEINQMASWLKKNPNEIILIDLEVKTKDGAGVTSPLIKAFGNLIYRPSDKKSKEWPTPRQMVKMGKRVFIKSANNTFGGEIIWTNGHFTFRAPGGYGQPMVKDLDLKNCLIKGSQINPRKFSGIYDSKIGKTLLPDRWVDKTGTISRKNMRAIMNCGINIIDTDRWSKRMLKSAVWTWGRWEPNNKKGNQHCAQMVPQKKYFWDDSDCQNKRHYSCQNKTNPFEWHVTNNVGPWADGSKVCLSETKGKYFFSVPKTPFQNYKLIQKAKKEKIWLNYTDKEREGFWKSEN